MGRTVLAREITAVDPSIVGRQLARPLRRLSAFACDVLLLLLPTVIVAAVASFGALFLTDRPAFDAFRVLLSESRTEVDRKAALAELVPMLCRLRDTGIPAEACAAELRGDRGRAVEILSDYRLILSFSTEHAETVVPADSIFVQVVDFIPNSIRTAAIFLVPALYFSLLTAGPRRATLGKRLFRIEVVKLDGGRLGKLESLERFGSYFAVLGTVGIGLADLWRDPHRQLAHDRVARTVVLRRS